MDNQTYSNDSCEFCLRKSGNRGNTKTGNPVSSLDAGVTVSPSRWKQLLLVVLGPNLLCSLCVLVGIGGLYFRDSNRCGLVETQLNNQLNSITQPVRRTLVFTEETDNSYVELLPQKNLSMQAFTLCMRLATELASDEREIILFAYRTVDFDELNVWREANSTYILYLQGSIDGVSFHLPELNTFQTNLCVTWESKSGLTAFHVDGKRSVRKMYKQGNIVQPGGRVILGQDPDSLLGSFDINQCFVGEIRDVNMWDYVLSDSMIGALHGGKLFPKGNIFDWDTVKLQVNGIDKEIIKTLWD
uniref:Pentraxin (PTX) domain-containing protein n=1 Tax=Esox lucius TaxID=8010 RepID=A0AAY5K7Y1_ESOLU